MHRILPQLVGSFLAVAILFAPFSFLGTPTTPQVYADTQDALETGAVGCAISALIGLGLSYASGESVPVSDIPGLIKDYALDCAAWVIGDVAIAIITTEMIGWVNEGFDGAPAYVQNLARYYQDVVDNEVGRYIQELTIRNQPFGEYLCEPFKLDIQAALLVDFGLPSIQKSSCTLTDIFENIEDYNDFIAGDFNKGGWDAWFNITTKPQNNPYGAYLLQRDNLSLRIASGVEEKKSEYETGGGFQGVKIQECNPPTQEDIDFWGEDVTEICNPEEIVTPGSAIKSALDGTLDLSNKRLANADELQEVLNKIVSSLVLDAFTKEGGLKGYDSDEASGLDLPDIEDVDIDTGGGGGAPKWGCLVDLEQWGPATQRVVWNGGTVVMDREGGRFGSDHAKRRIGGVAPGKYYRTATFEFDLYINRIDSFVKGEFDAILDFARNRITGTYAGYWGTGIAGKINTYLDNHGGDYFKNRTEWRAETLHRVKVTQDAQAGTVQIQVTALDGALAGQEIANLTYPHPGLDIIDTGDGLFVYLGEHPGWEYRDITVTLEPGAGAPYQGGVRGPCETGGGGGDPDTEQNNL